MRKFVIASLALIGGTMAFGTATSTPAAATEYPWCAYYTGPSSGQNCGFVSQAQCLANIHGVGGFCRLNPWYQGVEVYAVPRYRYF